MCRERKWNFRGNSYLWLLIAFAAVVSEATPMSPLRHLPEALQQIAVTRSFSLRGVLFGLPTGILVLSFGYTGVIAFLIFAPLHLPQPIFYCVVLRLPMFLGLVLALWIRTPAQKRWRTNGATFEFETGVT